MSFRTVVITKQSKISYKNRFLVVKQEDNEKYIHLSEIDTVIVDSISVSISSYLLKELADNKINIIFCDEKHNPFGELVPYYSKHNTSKMIKEQIKWKQSEKDKLWAEIVKNKIMNQALLLKKIKSSKYKLVLSYVNEVVDGDKTNREGHAAKVYFNALYGNNFVRNQDDSINAALNYGYAVLLSTINKEIINNGYLTQLGIHHKNEFNEFNLTCDLMEPFRVIIDNFIYYNQERKLDTDYKFDIVISSLAFHYVKDYNKLIKDIYSLLNKGGYLIFSQEHPFTTCIKYTENVNKGHTVIDGKYFGLFSDYNRPGIRAKEWFGKDVIKYHRTFTEIINVLVNNGFSIEKIEEPVASQESIVKNPKYINQFDRPFFLIVKAKKI